VKAGGVVRTLDESDELAFLRLRSKKYEIMIAPDRDYLLVVVQIPHDV
jgi:dynein light chain roadblock-type